MAAPFDTRKVEEMKREVLNLRQKKERLEAEQAQVPHEILRLNTIISGAPKEIIVLQRELKQLESTEKTLKQKQTVVAGALKTTTKTRPQEGKRIEEQIDTNETEMKQAQTELTALQQKIKTLEAEHGTLTQTLQTHRQTTMTDAKELPVAERQLQTQLEEITRAKDELRAKITEAQQKKTAAERDLQQKKSEEVKTKNLLRAAEREYDKVQRDLDSFNRQIQGQKAA